MLGDCCGTGCVRIGQGWWFRRACLAGYRASVKVRREPPVARYRKIECEFVHRIHRFEQTRKGGFLRQTRNLRQFEVSWKLLEIEYREIWGHLKNQKMLSDNLNNQSLHEKRLIAEQIVTLNILHFLNDWLRASLVQFLHFAQNIFVILIQNSNKFCSYINFMFFLVREMPSGKVQ